FRSTQRSSGRVLRLYAINKHSAGNKKELVILGAGWAGFRLIKDIDLAKYNVHVISPRNHFLFTPLLSSAASGTLEFRSVIEPIRRVHHSSNYHCYEGGVTDINPSNKTVTINPNDDQDAPFELRYDRLVIAIGCDVNTYGLPGVAENAYPIKEIHHARAIRKNIINCFERASNPNTSLELRRELLHFVVVGAGPTGIELAAELHDLMYQDLFKNFPQEIQLDVQMTVLEASPTILTAFDQSLQDYTRKVFTKERIRLRTETSVKEIPDPHTVVLADNSVIKCGMVIWSAGIGPRKVIKELRDKIPVDDKWKKIPVDDFLRVKDLKDVFAMGDCAVVSSKPLTATAQVAQQQGKYLANILNKIDSTDEVFENAEENHVLKPFFYRHQGLMAYIGSYKAVSDIGDVKIGGYASWLLWRSAYLTKLVSWKNKLLVPFDWAKTFFFGRDISKF
ncbi:NADH quinone reductase, partial [Acrasis kona]